MAETEPTASIGREAMSTEDSIDLENFSRDAWDTFMNLGTSFESLHEFVTSALTGKNSLAKMTLIQELQSMRQQLAETLSAVIRSSGDTATAIIRNIS